MGVTTFPFDLDIFLRSGSTTQPEIAASRHGRASCSRCARTTEANSQVRMISCAWGRRSIGKVRANRSSSSSHPVTIWADNEEVAQVSITSGSATKPPG